jgi:hypothetical protein
MTRECLWVSLGRSAFELRGLSAEQRDELSRSWGPFIRSRGLSEEATPPTVRWGRALEEWIVEFRVIENMTYTFMTSQTKGPLLKNHVI